MLEQNLYFFGSNGEIVMICTCIIGALNTFFSLPDLCTFQPLRCHITQDKIIISIVLLLQIFKNNNGGN